MMFLFNLYKFDDKKIDILNLRLHGHHHNHHILLFFLTVSIRIGAIFEKEGQNHVEVGVES